MSSRLDFLHANSDAIKAIAYRHKALKISVFGSVARGEDGPESDIDFLVTFAPDASLTDLAGLHDSLEEFLNAPVDVISREALNQEIAIFGKKPWPCDSLYGKKLLGCAPSSPMLTTRSMRKSFGMLLR